MIRTEHPRTKVSWTVIGVRRDPQARATDRAGDDKAGDDRGRYLDPALYGPPASRAVTPEAAPRSAGATGRPATLPSER